MTHHSLWGFFLFNDIHTIVHQLEYNQNILDFINVSCHEKSNVFTQRKKCVIKKNQFSFNFQKNINKL